MQIAMFTTSAKNSKSSPCACIMFLMHSTMVLFVCLETPFCCSVYGTLVYRWIPHSHKKSSIVFYTNSPLLSDHKVLIFMLISLSTKALYALNLSNNLPFTFKMVDMSFSRKVVNEGDKVSCSITRCGLR